MNNARPINRLRSGHPASSGTVLREAGRPLRERAGREPGHDASPSFHHRIKRTIRTIYYIVHITVMASKEPAIAAPTPRCDNQHNRIAEAKEAAYGGRPARL